MVGFYMLRRTARIQRCSACDSSDPRMSRSETCSKQKWMSYKWAYRLSGTNDPSVVRYNLANDAASSRTPIQVITFPRNDLDRNGTS